MDNEELIETTCDEHKRIIIHIDIDCFYAQVEEIRDQSLRTKPLGIQQKNLVVTCNYVARKYGVKKLMLLSEAKKLCPNLVLVNGEDLSNYRTMSSRIFDILLMFTPLVEKLGMDENWLDVTDVVEKKIQEFCDNSDISLIPEVHIYPEGASLEQCDCGYDKRLIIGSNLAKEIRDRLFNVLEITCCAGIAHNKLLAKVVGSKNKPNKQTILIPKYSRKILNNTSTIRQIIGIGEKTEKILNGIGIITVSDLQNIELDNLKRIVGYEQANKLKDLSFGIDNSLVKLSGKPKSISLEDACKSISLRAEVEDKFRILLKRLIRLVVDDGRVPVTLKIILRKFDNNKKVSHRETKQTNIQSNIFKQINGRILVTDGGEEILLKLIMKLVEKTIDLKRLFNITLLGLAFTKFQEQKRGPNSIANFFIKQTDIEVQSIISLGNTDRSSSNSNSIEYYKCRDPSRISSSPMCTDPDLSDTMSIASCSSDISESDIEPSPKKKKIVFPFTKKRLHLNPIDCYDSSPSKLRVGDLRLNSREFDSPVPSTSNQITHNTVPAVNSTSTHPAQISNEVFKELPLDIQHELLESWCMPINRTKPQSSSSETKAKNNTLHRYFITN